MTELNEKLTAKEMEFAEAVADDFDATINKFANVAKTQEDLAKKVANSFIAMAYSLKSKPTKRSLRLSEMKDTLDTNPHTKGAIARHIVKVLKECCGIEHKRGWIISAEKSAQYDAQKWVKENSILTYGDKTPEEKEKDRQDKKDAKKAKEKEKQDQLDKDNNPYSEVLELLTPVLEAQVKRAKDISRVITENAPEIEQARVKRENTKIEILEGIIDNLKSRGGVIG